MDEIKGIAHFHNEEEDRLTVIRLTDSGIRPPDDKRTQVVTDDYAIYQDDCLEVMPQLPDESVDLSIYSPPFATGDGGLYHYSSSPRDLSNSRDYTEFFQHYEFVAREVWRLTKPGRISAVHCMDVPQSNSGHGDPLMDFGGDIIRLHCRCRDDSCTSSRIERENGLCGHGWFEFAARICIWKEPLAVRNRTMAKRLAHATIVDDATLAGIAGADYLLIFRKRGKNEVPVTHPNGFTDYVGERPLPAEVLKYRGWTGNQIENQYSHQVWRRYASSFWDDIQVDNVLPFREGTDENDERHVHPLQLDVIERVVVLWSNPGETVLTPFMGVGSEVYGAVKHGRKGIGIELKDTYFAQAVRNLEAVEKESVSEPTLFDWAAANGQGALL